MVGYFDTEKGVNEYIQMASGYDGTKLIEILRKYLPEKSTVLEIGMGPGVDLDILRKHYTVTGSDNSSVFLERYKKKNKDADLILLDAVTLHTEREWDGIYSNKVLHHLTKEELKKSLSRQKEILNQNGILFHSFWKGTKTENFEGLLFQYYEMKELEGIVKNDYDVLELKTYTEMEKDDSIYVVLKKR
ncbi:class I SAM-dependent methyltransferase [Nitrosopumilus sp.]|uniref:class I SAM-dependent methyltransferase n=1 Tax=Nitrosopumilus sp. TaxID=2024843 RepID=UPI00293042F1|nr:class I SAM-dependent methyltransferase [Nitrosopumilus sp.]